MTGHDNDIARTSIGAYADGGGIVNVGGNAVGTSYGDGGSGSRHDAKRSGRRVDIGILTVLDEEMRAVVHCLRRHSGYRTFALSDGAQAHEARVSTDERDVRVAALQTLEQGQRSAILALERLQRHFRPRIVLLVGIAGAVRDDVSIGDIVIGEEVIYYDARRETNEGPRRRGQTHTMTPFIRHRVHEFFVQYGDSLTTEPDDGHARIFRGPIGTGDAVITDAASEIVDWLRRYNEKVLAVETEAGGVGQACYENVDSDRSLDGWLTIRGISDTASTHDWHDRRFFASCRAALVMDRLLPLLVPRGDT